MVQSENNPLGMHLEPETVEAWWQYIAWPRYRTYGYRNHKRAVTRWWSQVGRVDLSRARSALAHAQEAEAQRVQNELGVMCTQGAIDKYLDSSKEVQAALRAMLGSPTR